MDIKYANAPISIAELVQEHRENNCVLSAYKLNFIGVDGFDVYNICQSFELEGKTYLAGRVEKRESELSCIRFFEKIDQTTYQAIDTKLAFMQDPCVCSIDNELVVGGTQIFTKKDSIYSWRTAFYKGRSLDKLECLAFAPKKMKDVRLYQTDKIHIFTRPQGGQAKKGRIGYTAIASIEEISTAVMQNATILSGHFDKECWGGVNQVHLLKNNLLGIVGHIATMSKGDKRHYYGMVFCFNPENRKSTNIKIVAERVDFSKGEYKRRDLMDVVFLGGINRNGDGTATLFAGVSDAEAHCALIKDPFIEYEDGELNE